MSEPKYVKHDHLSLKDHERFNEKWLQDLIEADPSILGLPGQPSVLDRERRQERAGRLDLLLHDHELDRRFELELMLGSMDESHIIRCIEYWDIERRRYPAYDHVAVLVAEDVTGRFLNILSLLAGTIPMIVLQCAALRVEDSVLLHFVKVLDQTSLRRDDEDGPVSKPATRDYWSARVGDQILSMCDAALAMVNDKAKTKYSLNFNQGYIGLNDGVRSRNFVILGPRKKKLHVSAVVLDVDSWVQRFKAAGFDAEPEKNGARICVTFVPEELPKLQPDLEALIQRAVEEFEA